MQVDRASYRSPNYDNRPAGAGIRAIVIHTTEGIWPSDAQWLSSKTSGVSTHYVIGPDGAVYQLVNDERRAWHAGISQFAGLSNWNNFSIGIEISHKKGVSYRATQRLMCRALCLDLIARHPIVQELVVAHRWIAPLRRQDPTDWPDAELKTWIADLFPPASPAGAGFHRVTHPQVIFEAPRGDGALALDGVAILAEGEVVEIDGVNNGFAHIASGIGFVPVSILEAV